MNQHVDRTPLPRVAALLMGIVATVLLPIGHADAGARHGAPERAPTRPSSSAPAPQLSVAVDDGQPSAGVGDLLHYEITVENLGPDAVTGLRISQSVPAGLSFKKADADGDDQADSVDWKLNLKPSGTTTLNTSMRVVVTPDDLLRLATVVCARETPTGPPIVCATDSNQLPAGVAANRDGSAEASDASSARFEWWYIAVLGLVFALAALFILRRRRAPRLPD